MESIENQAASAIKLLIRSVREQAQEGYKNISDAARYLGKSIGWVRNRMADGTFKEKEHFWRRDGSIFFAVEALDRWVKEEEIDGKSLQPRSENLAEFVRKRAAGKAINRP
jgi:hypothetical protein